MRALCVLSVLSTAAFAQSVSGFDPHLTAQPRDGGLLLEWNALAGSGPVSVRRQDVGGVALTSVATLDAGTTAWFEPSFPLGGRAVYRVQRTQQGGSQGEGVVIAGAEAPFRDDQGVVLVLVDTANAARLRVQLDQLAEDLRDDGFQVVEQSVAPDEAPPVMKARIALLAAQGRLTHVVLLGAVPRVRSGIQAPDGHGDHYGAWVADPYYADLTGRTWTDTLVGGVGSFANDAGDGRFDQTYSSPVEVALGRVDFENMPVFGPDAGTVQLGRYLDKVHAFRTGGAPRSRRAVVADSFGYFGGEAFGRAGWRDAAAINGVEPQVLPFFPTLEEDAGVLLAWGDGAGSPTSAGGVTTSSQLAMSLPRTRFMGLFGSYFGDWNYQNNLMRAALGSGDVVASLWFARPQVQLHALGALESFGETYARDPALRLRSMPVYQALLGDPTLRLFYPVKVNGLSAVPSVDGVRLSWSAWLGPELIGYHVYRRPSGSSGAPARVTTAPVTSAMLLDTSAAPDTSYEWRVVAVVRETTGSGTFWNHSLGSRATATTLPVGVDAGGPDAGTADAGTADAGALDAGESDAGEADAGGSDGGGPTLDAGMPPPLPVDPVPGGCGCATGESSAALLLFAVGLWRANRRPHAQPIT